MQRWFLDKCDGVNFNYVCATCVEEMKISDRNNDVNFVASMSAANSYSCNLQFTKNLVTVSISTHQKNKKTENCNSKKKLFYTVFLHIFFLLLFNEFSHIKIGSELRFVTYLSRKIENTVGI